MKKTLEFDWPILSGSISTARSRCGKPRCACKLRPPRLHGIYYRWTGFIEGKRTTKTISKEAAQECLRRIRNYHRLQRDIEKLLRADLAKAPWNPPSRPPRTKSEGS
ncbi:DUF6788 family protein [Edaphobacter sp.]|uniref:DUF6788 family protein n=1 Tax=Edaphobacter sp. TaxID=1934404 RepID=UPI0039C88DCB